MVPLLLCGSGSIRRGLRQLFLGIIRHRHSVSDSRRHRFRSRHAHQLCHFQIPCLPWRTQVAGRRDSHGIPNRRHRTDILGIRDMVLYGESGHSLPCFQTDHDHHRLCMELPRPQILHVLQAFQYPQER